uniref:EXPERA domain-containing protein n=1 Tax=Pavo cristatus TaxID=9049 RepID=A0A8C9F082_PAVCR
MVFLVPYACLTFCTREGHALSPLQAVLAVFMCAFVLSLQLTELLHWYATTFRDPMMLHPPAWFKAFIYCEAALQLPFFPVAAYAFLKGWYE